MLLCAAFPTQLTVHRCPVVRGVVVPPLLPGPGSCSASDSPTVAPAGLSPKLPSACARQIGLKWDLALEAGTLVGEDCVVPLECQAASGYLEAGQPPRRCAGTHPTSPVLLQQTLVPSLR